MLLFTEWWKSTVVFSVIFLAYSCNIQFLWLTNIGNLDKFFLINTSDNWYVGPYDASFDLLPYKIDSRLIYRLLSAFYVPKENLGI